MRTICITGQERPHVMHDSCWCKPTQQVCENGCCQVVVHHDVEPRPDVQARMSAYSEQYVRGMAPDSG